MKNPILDNEHFAKYTFFIIGNLDNKKTDIKPSVFNDIISYDWLAFAQSVNFLSKYK